MNAASSNLVLICLLATEVAAAADPGQVQGPSNPAVAQPSSSGAPSGRATPDADLQEVVVTSHYQFLGADTSGTTNLPVPIEQVPQSISLVSDDFIKAADLKTLGEIAEYTPGALNVGNQEGFQSLVKLRGFVVTPALDGINQITAYYEPDNAIFDRVELVKGPSSVVYGTSNPGGVVNYVTKSATSDAKDYVYAQAGSWHTFRLEGQMVGALDTDGHVRGIGVVVQDQGDSFTSDVYHKKTSLYAGLNFDWGGAVNAYLHGGFERFDRTSFDGIPTQPDGSPAPVARSFFIGAPDIVMTTETYHAEGNLTWHATDMLDVDVKGNYQNVNTHGSLAFSSGLQESGDLTLSADYIKQPVVNYGLGVSSVYKLDDLGWKKSFISLAALYQSSTLRFDELTPAVTPTANLFAGQTALISAFDSVLAQANVPFSYSTHNTQLTFAEQTWLQLLDPLSLLLGASWTKPEMTTTGSYATNGIEQGFSLGSRVSYRAGLTYEVLPKTFAYFSYSQSFVPQPVQPSTNGSIAALAPLSGEQYELGLKFRSDQGNLLLTGAVFNLREDNVLQYLSASTLTGVTYYQATGQVTHKGIELQALGKLTPEWQINAGYALLDPKITGAAPGQAAAIGQTETFLPRQTASLYTTYALQSGPLAGLSVGAGLRYVGSQKTSFNNELANEQFGQSPTVTRDLASYTLVDVNLGYAWDKWLVQLNAHNLFNRNYLINNYQTLFFGNQPGEPCNVVLSLRRTF